MSSSLIDVIRQHAPTPTGPSASPARLDDPHDLLTALARVPDPRDPRGVRYRLASLPAVPGGAVRAGGGPCGATSAGAAARAPAAGIRLGFPGGIPALTTLWRL